MKKRQMNLQLFAEPAQVDTAGSNAPDNNPANNADGQVEPENEELQELKRQLEAEKKKTAEANKIIDKERATRKQIEREKMTDAEQLAEQRKEIEEKAKQYDRQINAVAAEKLLVAAGLKEDDYKDFLDLFVSEDADKTASIAQGFVDILNRQKTLAAKAEREKVLKEMPEPPAGDGSKTSATLQDEMRAQLFPTK